MCKNRKKLEILDKEKKQKFRGERERKGRYKMQDTRQLRWRKGVGREMRRYMEWS
jgi:hypothetical protein